MRTKLMQYANGRPFTVLCHSSSVNQQLHFMNGNFGGYETELAKDIIDFDTGEYLCDHVCDLSIIKDAFCILEVTTYQYMRSNFTLDLGLRLNHLVYCILAATYKDISLYIPPYVDATISIINRSIIDKAYRSQREAPVYNGRCLAFDWRGVWDLTYPGYNAEDLEDGFVIESETDDTVTLYNAKTVDRFTAFKTLDAALYDYKINPVAQKWKDDRTKKNGG